MTSQKLDRPTAMCFTCKTEYAQPVSRLGDSPTMFLAAPVAGPVAAVHFRKKATTKKETADALGSLIIAVQAMIDGEADEAESA